MPTIPRTILAVTLLASCFHPAISGVDPYPGASPRSIDLVDFVLSDDGDDDGWADTNETVTLRLHLRNATGQDLTGVVARLTTTDARIRCIPRPVIVVGDLPDGATLKTDAGFTFIVAESDRPSLGEPFTADFTVLFGYDGLPAGLPQEQPLVLDLDLDASGAEQPTTFFEGFEGGLGSFGPMHLDEDLNPPDDDLGNDYAGRRNSDGYRCQYDDPDFQRVICADCYDYSCYLNPNGASDEFHFQPTGDRAFSGASALYFGVALESGLGFTTPLGQLEAVATTEPVNLAWKRRCSTTATIACETELDCPVGEECLLPRPVLSLKQQVDFLDHRTIESLDDYQQGIDRGVVQLQAADAAGTPVGAWITLDAYLNPYDTQPQSRFFSNCSFDPVDDGNDEESYFFPEIPSRAYGPSSTCYPTYTYVHQGDTDAPFDPSAVGDARDGPGLEGQSGAGTWIESSFSLSRFRGQRVRLRLLASTLKAGGVMHWEEGFQFNPAPGDDGWFVDDVSVSGSTTSAAVLAADDKPNLLLPGQLDEDADGLVCDNCADTPNADQLDADSDGIGDACDVCPVDFADDIDDDGLCCNEDNCCSAFNPNQVDGDGDGVGDACDNCPDRANADQTDRVHPGGAGDACDDPDGDGIVDADDNCPDLAAVDQGDLDGDGVGDPCDNCPPSFNPDQEDVDEDGVGNVCDPCATYPLGDDTDGDGSEDGCDNCPLVPNPDQADADADLHGDACDSCPLEANADQADADGDGMGDACDLCPDGDAADTDADGVVCDSDNCPDFANADQADADGDGIGDVCDSCRFDPLNDVDADGACRGVDNCPTRHNWQVPPAIRLSGPLDDHDRIAGFDIAPDGRHVAFNVYRGHTDTWALYSNAANGGDLTRLSADLAPGAGVHSFDVAADGAVVFMVEQYVEDEPQLFSVPITGGTGVRLNPGGVVRVTEVSPDGRTVVFRVDDAATASQRVYSSPSAGGELRLLIDAASASFSISPDSTTVVLAADPDGDGIAGLYAVPIGSGPPVMLSASLRPGTNFWSQQVSENAANVVFRADGEVPFRYELYATPLTGGTPQKRSLPLEPGSDVIDFAISRDGAWTVYRVDSNANFPWPSRRVLYSTPTLGGGSATLLEGSGNVRTYAISPDGGTVVYCLDPASPPAPDELWSVPIGGGVGTLLNGPLPAGRRNVAGFTLTADGSTVIYRTEETAGVLELFSVPIDGGTPVRLHPPLEQYEDVIAFIVEPDNEVVFLAGKGLENERLYRVPARGGTPLLVAAGRGPISEFAVSPDERLVYLDTFPSDGLFATIAAGDADEDGIVDGCDVCRDVADPEQVDTDADGFGALCDCRDVLDTVYPGAPEVNDGLDNQCPGDAGFGLIDETSGTSGFLAGDKTTYAWPPQSGAEQYEVARSTRRDFAGACTIYGVTEPGFIDAEVPPPRQVFHYLNRPSLPFAGSWGRSRAGVERTIDCVP